MSDPFSQAETDDMHLAASSTSLTQYNDIFAPSHLECTCGLRDDLYCIDCQLRGVMPTLFQNPLEISFLLEQELLMLADQ